MSGVELMDTQQEAILADLVKRATVLMNDGAAPTDAVVQTVRNVDLSPHMVERICQAINVGRTLASFKQGGSDLVDFPLVDAREVLRKLYDDVDLTVHLPPISVPQPEQKAAAATVSFDLTFPDSPTADTRLDNSNLPKEALWQARELRRIHEYRWRQEKAACQQAEDEFIKKIGSFLEYMTQQAPHRIDELHQLVPCVLPEAAPLLAVLPAATQTTKVASRVLVHLADPPYDLLQQAATALRAAKTAQEDVRHAEEMYRQADIVVQRISRGGRPLQPYLDDLDEAAQQKEATDGMLSIPGVDLNAASSPVTTSRRFLRSLDDPRHRAELKGVKTLTGLHEMLTTDDVLSEYDPQDVVTLYNELVSLVPGLADKPIVLRGALRKAMQQGRVLEPFELAQLADISATRSRTDVDTLRDQNVMKSLYAGGGD